MSKRRMTNRQLAHWLASAKGQIAIHCVVYNAYHYPIEADNGPVPDGVMIREWGHVKWEEPRIEVPQLEGQTT